MEITHESVGNYFLQVYSNSFVYNMNGKPTLAYFNEEGGNVWELGDEICENVVYFFINKTIKQKFKVL